MNYIRTILLVPLLLSGFSAWTQQAVPRKPLVEEKFDKVFLSENFDSTGSSWTTLSNSDNLILVQDGEYILNRKATFSPYATLGNFQNNLNAYRLVTSFKLEKAATDDGSIGLIFMAQAGGQGGFIFEINKIQQYRLRQIAGNTYEYLTGTPKDGGWVKSSFVKPLNTPNLVELKTYDKKYDISINNVLLLSFTEIAYKSGGIGFIIGPGSKAKVDFLYLFTNQKGQDLNSELNHTKSNNDQETDILSLAESIITLKTQVNKLQEENDDLKHVINAMKASEKESDALSAEYEKTIKSFDQQQKSYQTTFDSLIKINQSLLKYKEMVDGNDGGDVVISLSKSLKAEKLKNENLLKENKELKDSVLILQSINKSSKSKPDKEVEILYPDSTPPKSKNEFNLPSGN